MNQWSRRRKRVILLIVVFVVVFLIGVPGFFLFYRAPTCFDGSQNGNETGIDCGGSCQLLCTTESLPLILKGDPRILKVATSTFEIVVLIENSNTAAEIYRARYSLKLYDNLSTLPFKVIEGETYVPKGATFAIFQGPFSLEGGVVPTRVVFEWQEGSLVWRKNTQKTPELMVKDMNLTRLDSSPRLDARIENNSLEDVSNIDLVALVSDDSGNIIAASKTFIDTLPAGKGSSVVFSWPRPFEKQALGTSIITRILPDRSFIR